MLIRKKSKKDKNAIELLSAGNDNLAADTPPSNGPVGAAQVFPYEVDANESKDAKANQYVYRGPKVDTYEVSGTHGLTRDEKTWREQGPTVNEMGLDEAEVRSPRSPAPMYSENIMPVELDGTSASKSIQRY